MLTLRTSRRTYLLAGVIAVVLSARPSAANWPQWRGPLGQGVSAETQLPTAWSPQQNVAWKVPIAGRGHSAPVVWGSRIFLTTAIEGDVIPAHSVVQHLNGGEPFVHPDSVAGNRRHTLKVMALDAHRESVPKPAIFMASPVAFGDYVLLTNEDGDTFFVKAGTSHGVAHVSSVDEPVYASLALSNGRIYIRGERHLYAIGG